MDLFVRDLEKATSAHIEQFDIRKTWRDASPNGSKQEIDDYPSTTLTRIQLWGFYHNNLPVRKAYHGRHGHEPYANLLVKSKGDLGEKLIKEDFRTPCNEQEVYSESLWKDVLTSASTIIACPGSAQELAYRDACHA